MSRMMDALFADAKMKCTICGTETTGMDRNCDCWSTCKCGWFFEKGGWCRNPQHKTERSE